LEGGGRAERRHRFRKRPSIQTDRARRIGTKKEAFNTALRLRVSAVHPLRSSVGVEQSGVALRFPPHSMVTGVFYAPGVSNLGGGFG
jgi:hypothetical protein